MKLRKDKYSVGGNIYRNKGGNVSNTMIFIVLLQDDLGQAKKLIKTSDDETDFPRRTYVRTVFALIEAVLFKLKQRILNISLDKKDLLDSHTENLLKGVTEEVNNNGDVSIRTRFLKLKNDIRFTFKIYAKVFQISNKANYSDLGWDNFLDAIQLRNRLMHPKFLRDLEVSNDDILLVESGLNWFLENSEIFLNGNSSAKKYDDWDK